MTKPYDAEGVRQAEARARGVAEAVRPFPSDGVEAGTLHAYGAAALLKELRAVLEVDVPALAEAVRAREDDAERLRGQLGEARRERPVLVAAAADDGAEEDLGSLLSAPFRVTPAMVKEAKSEPLVALAVQVARGAGPDAGEVDRARLIAMAFAAGRGDMDAFWAARRQRKQAAAGQGPKPARKK